MENISFTPKMCPQGHISLCPLAVNLSNHPQPVTTDLISVPAILSYPECHINISFHIQLFSLCLMPLKSIHFGVCTSVFCSFLLLLSKSISTEWMYHNLFVFPSSDEYLSYFQLSDYVQSCYKHFHISLCVNMYLYSSWVTQERDCQTIE